MTEYTKYVADDGVEFDDYYECQEYEQKMHFEEIAKDIVALDLCGEPVKDITKTDDIFFLFISSNEAANALNELESDGWPWSGKDIRCVSCPQAGRFLYDTDIERWVNIDTTKELIKEAEYYFEAL